MRNHKSQRQREFHQGKGDQEQQAQQGAGRMKTGGRILAILVTSKKAISGITWSRMTEKVKWEGK